MPASHPPIHNHPGKPFRTLGDAARDGHLMLIRCNLCRRSTYFHASDLVKVVDPRHPLHRPPFPCSRCKTAEYLRMTPHSPRAGDFGRLPVRVLDKVVQVHKWRDTKLGDTN